MKNKQSAAVRNTMRVGRNAMSYNGKHPTNPIDLRPIHNACSVIHKDDFKLRRRLRGLANLSRPQIARGIVCLTRI
jgi:hypothetical protein